MTLMGGDHLRVRLGQGMWYVACGSREVTSELHLINVKGQITLNLLPQT